VRPAAYRPGATPLPAAGQYGESYYRTGNYHDYLGRAARYRRTAAHLTDSLYARDLIDARSSILDFGCGVGFLLRGFRALGFQNLAGCEVSEWAAAQARRKGLDVAVPDRPGRYDLVTYLDVLEHMSDDEVVEAILRHPARVIVVRIPVSTDGGRTFHLPVSRADPTHVNCKDKAAWRGTLRAGGYDRVVPLDRPTIYDSDGVMACLAYSVATRGRR
jgi:SAM-dependent methyltransferase